MLQVLQQSSALQYAMWLDGCHRLVTARCSGSTVLSYSQLLGCAGCVVLWHLHLSGDLMVALQDFMACSSPLHRAAFFLADVLVRSHLGICRHSRLFPGAPMSWVAREQSSTSKDAVGSGFCIIWLPCIFLPRQLPVGSLASRWLISICLDLPASA